MSVNASKAQPLLRSVVSQVSDPELQRALQDELLDSKNDLNGLQPYFQHYEQQCVQASVAQGDHCSARIHKDVVDVVKSIKASEPFDKILQQVQERHRNKNEQVEERKMIRTIELAARVASMHEVGKWKSVSSQLCRLDWTCGTLSNCLSTFHDPPSTSPCGATGRLPTLFNIVNIERLAGITVETTSNLADHLNVRDLGSDGKMMLSIFHHATYLKMMLKDDKQTLFTQDFLMETLLTMSLLFPYNDKSTRRWFKKKEEKEGLPLDWEVLISGWISPAQRDLKHFKFWRERLSILKQIFDEAEPGTIAQWWADPRRRAQRYTFWVAVLVLILTIIFGLIQCTEGALQVYKAYYPSGGE